MSFTAIFSSLGTSRLRQLGFLHTAQCKIITHQIRSSHVLKARGRSRSRLKGSDKDDQEDGKGPHPAIHYIPKKTKPPHPWLTDQLAARSLKILFKRSWYIWEHLIPGTPHQATLALRKEIPFDRNKDGIELGYRLLANMVAEKNHATIRVNDSSLTFITYTEHAVPPMPSFKEHAVDKPEYKPGITSADVRMAYIVEKIYDEYFRSNNLPLPTPRSIPPQMYIPTTFGTISTQIVNAPVQGRLCKACGGEHSFDRCPERHNIKPPSPCNFCGKDHWTIDCPKAQKCLACGQNHHVKNCPIRKNYKPPKPCANCGGDHWIFDCPQPHECLACHGNHHVRDCPVRDTIKPKPCDYCDEAHWRVDCPHALDKCRACGGDHILRDCPDRLYIPPPHPCNECGGDHWTMDCRANIQCVACGGNHILKDCPDRVRIKPLSPCSHCGSSDHWDVDCPSPKPCPACGGPHLLSDCQDRGRIPVRYPCKNCGGHHWLVDCPHGFRCPACGGEHTLRACTKRKDIPPRHLCLFCGANHWSVDCPHQHPSGEELPSASVEGVMDAIVRLARTHSNPTSSSTTG